MGNALSWVSSFWSEESQWDDQVRNGGFQKESTPSVQIVLEKEVPEGGNASHIHLEVNLAEPVSVFRKLVSTIFQEAEANVCLVYNGETLTDDDTLLAKGVSYGTRIVYHNRRLDEDAPLTSS